jgi:hypothetical protein
MTREPFVPGLQLSERFFREAVRPILAMRFPELVYSAAHLGHGSDVLGFDTARSTDHGWGPKVTLFVAEADLPRYREAIVRHLAETLPYEFLGYPTHFAEPEIDGGRLMPIASGPINHGVRVATVRSFFTRLLGLDPTGEIGPVDWLLLPEQRLRAATAGRVFHDGLGALEAVRAKLRYYPRDVWLYRLACQWRRIEQEEPFVARCGDVGDELGSRLIAARLVRDLMALGFLMERTYAPYGKWFGTAFARLACAATLTPFFERVLSAPHWREREAHLALAYETVATMHNALAIAEPLPTRVSPFHGRPYLVIHGDRFAAAIRAAIQSDEIRRLPPHIGAVDQFADSTDVLSYPEHSARLAAIYGD